MDYLVCLDHRPIHLTCRAAWLADALVRERMFAQQRGPVVHTSAPEARIEVLLSYRPVKAARVFTQCAGGSDLPAGTVISGRRDR